MWITFWGIEYHPSPNCIVNFPNPCFSANLEFLECSWVRGSFLCHPEIDKIARFYTCISSKIRIILSNFKKE